MSLAQRINTEILKPRHHFETWVDQLSEEDHTALMDAAANPDWSNRGLLDVVNAEGAHVGRDYLTAWRKRVTQ